jgi:type VI secretion system ImpM family protein
VKPGDAWVWGAAGKHPVVKDYITLGEETQVLRAFSRWVEEGYSRVKETGAQRSWRFFTRGLKPEDLACGLVRDSHDKAGRPFPLIMMGYGRVEGWDRQWELLPWAFDGVWSRLEFMSVKRVLDLDELKGDISRLPVPELNGTFKELPGNADAALGDMLSRGQRDKATLLLNGAGDPRDEAVTLLKGMRGKSFPVPAAVFIGGPQDRVMLAVFMKSLSTTDFEELWAAG